MNRRQLLKISALASAGLLINPKDIMAQILSQSFTRADFGKDFLWGVATAAAQIEGAWNVDGKSPSIWDVFTEKRGKIKDKSTTKVACDFYHKYKEDIALMASLNLQVNRFSIAWSRVLPYGTKHVNQRGIDFYDRVIDETLKNGMQPWITLYHWDLPQILEDKGGWTNRDVVDWFSEYTDLCSRRFGDRVSNWMIFNEPMAFTGLGYLGGMHAPGERGLGKFLKATHHTTLCQAEGGRIVRANVPGANVGTTYSVTAVEPKNPNKEKDIIAARKADALFNRLFVEPALGMGYPIEDLPIIKGITKYMKPGDEEKMKFDFDFLGVQNYFRTVAKFSLWPPLMWANVVKGKNLVENKEDLTAMGWETSPDGFYRVLKQFGKYRKPLIVTENGAAFEDHLSSDGTVNDPKRIQFFKEYLANMLQAKQEGVDIRGYFIWTFMDNFEWAEGYEPRFGIVYNDYATQTRYVKDSGKWWREFLR